jgi:two-component sensor histidine kinase
MKIGGKETLSPSSRLIRLHLEDAHQRVMSVATVQQQLRASGLNESIEIGPYLSKLCDSLAKSMIGDRRRSQSGCNRPPEAEHPVWP